MEATAVVIVPTTIAGCRCVRVGFMVVS